MKVTPENLEAAVVKILEDYADQVAVDVKEAVEQTGKATAQLAQAYASRIGRGKYAKSIKAKTTQTTTFGTTVTIFSTQYRIAHLLEHGHVVKSHGRVVGTARAFPHFAPAEQKGEELLMQKVRKAI